VPHTPGNWAGHIYFPLAPTTPSSSAGCSSIYDATNRAASRRLYAAAGELIEDFAAVWNERFRGQNSKIGDGCGDELEDLRVISHLPPLPLEQDDSSSDEEDDDESTCSSGEDSNEGDRRGSGRASGRPYREIRQGEKGAQAVVAAAIHEKGESAPPLHISLSRPFYLQQQSISSFVEHMRTTLAPYSPMPITLDATNPEVLANDEKTRSFLTIPAVQKTHGSSLIRMIRSLDAVMERYGQAPYYEEAKIHTSVASISGDARGLLAGTPYSGDCGGNLSSQKVARKGRGSTCDVPKPTQNMGVTFMVDRVMLTFGTTKEYCILLERM